MPRNNEASKVIFISYSEGSSSWVFKVKVVRDDQYDTFGPNVGLLERSISYVRWKCSMMENMGKHHRDAKLMNQIYKLQQWQDMIRNRVHLENQAVKEPRNL